MSYTRTGNPSSAFSPHNHRGCVDAALRDARDSCTNNGLRLTKLRRRVLEILLEAHRALGAYDILDRLKAEGLGSQPPIAYRALEFLVENGFAHKIQKLNAFVACAHPGATHSPVFMICRNCRSVAEAQSTASTGAVGRAAKAIGFSIEATVVEADGLCPRCKGGVAQ